MGRDLGRAGIVTRRRAPFRNRRSENASLRSQWRRAMVRSGGSAGEAERLENGLEAAREGG